MSDIKLSDALAGRRSIRSFSDRPVPLDAVERLLFAAQGETDGSGNRTAPSAQALRPLRLTVTAGLVDGKPCGIYRVEDDLRTLTGIIDSDQRKPLEDAALGEQPWIGKAAGIITISADLAAPTLAFAEQPPYGARGHRYAFLEAGAAAQNVLLQAVAEGLGIVLVAGFRDEATAALLALEAPVSPILHLCFGWPG